MAHRPQAARRIGDVTACMIVGMLAVATLPAASAHPAVSSGWAALSGLLLAAHSIALRRVEPARPTAARRLWPIALPAMGLALAALLQGLLGQFWTTRFAGQSVPLGSLAPMATLAGAVRWFGYGALFILTAEVAARPGRARAMVWAFIGIAGGQAVWALFSLRYLDGQSPWGTPSAYPGSATGTYVNRNAFAAFLGMALVSGLALFGDRLARASGRGWRLRDLIDERGLATVAGVLVLSAVTVALMATQSRMGVAATAMGAAAVVFSARRLGAAARPFATAIAGVGGAIAAFGFGSGLFDRGLVAFADLQGRLELYRQVLGIVRDRPIFGVGLDAFPIAFELVHAPPVPAGLTWETAHSTYLALWSEAGLVAGSLPVLAVAISARRLISRLRPERSDAGLALAALGVIVLGAGHSAVDFVLEVPANAMAFVFLLAIGLAPRRGAGRE